MTDESSAVYQARIFRLESGKIGAHVMRHGIPITTDHEFDSEEAAAEWARSHVAYLKGVAAAHTAGEVIDL